MSARYLYTICKSIISHQFDNSVEGVQDVGHGCCSISRLEGFITNSNEFDDSLMFDKLVSDRVEIILIRGDKFFLITFNF